MTDKQAQIFKVNTKPATGVVGGIYFVKSEKKTYIYSENGWEPYNNADEATHATNADKATTATKLTNKLTAGSKTYDGSAAVSLTKADLGLGNVDNTSDATKQVYEANLKWGGKNFAGSYGPIDAALISTLGANRFAFMGADTIDIEYSRDAGETWLDYDASDADKISLFSIDSAANMLIGKSTRTEPNNCTVDCLLRVTLKCRLESGSKTNLYTNLNKICILASTNGTTGGYCTVQISKNGSLDNWDTVAEKVSIMGWSGYNIINIPATIVGGYIQNIGQNNYIRFIFGITGFGSYNDGITDGLSILNIFGFGGVGWDTPSNMARNGHLYTYDTLQSATFPNGLECVGNFTSRGYVYSTSDVYEHGKALSQIYVQQQSGKQLSTNDYTTAEKNKLAGLVNAEALTNDEIDTVIK